MIGLLSRAGWTLCVAFLVLIALSPTAHSKCSCTAYEVINCGHRGVGKSKAGDPFPENTIVSFEEAVAQGATMVELDVIHSKDGVLIVIHDDKVDRTTNGSGCAGHMTVAELQMLDAAAGTLLEGTGVVIPTLTEVLAALDIDVNVEIKINDTSGCPASDKAKLAADVVAAIEADTKKRSIVVSSFNMATLDEVEKISPETYLGLITFSNNQVQEAKDHGFDAINLMGGATKEETVDAAHEAGLDINVWTVNEPELMATLLDYGVDMMITDVPAVFGKAQSDWCAANTSPCDDTVESSSCSLSSAPGQPRGGGWLLLTVGAWLWVGRRRHRE